MENPQYRRFGTLARPEPPERGRATARGPLGSAAGSGPKAPMHCQRDRRQPEEPVRHETEEGARPARLDDPDFEPGSAGGFGADRGPFRCRVGIGRLRAPAENREQNQPCQDQDHGQGLRVAVPFSRSTMETSFVAESMQVPGSVGSRPLSRCPRDPCAVPFPAYCGASIPWVWPALSPANFGARTDASSSRSSPRLWG